MLVGLPGCNWYGNAIYQLMAFRRVEDALEALFGFMGNGVGKVFGTAPEAMFQSCVYLVVKLTGFNFVKYQGA